MAKNQRFASKNRPFKQGAKVSQNLFLANFNWLKTLILVGFKLFLPKFILNQVIPHVIFHASLKRMEWICVTH
jgi:hypothetical protein